MSFLKKLFGKSDYKTNDTKSKQSLLEKEGNQIIGQLLENYQKNKASGIDVKSRIQKTSDSFKSNFNIGLEELAANEDKLINWLTQRNFTQNELGCLSDLFLEHCSNIQENDSSNQLGIFLINAINNISMFAITDRNISDFEKFQNNADRASKLLQNFNQSTETKNTTSNSKLSEVELKFKNEIEDTFSYYFSTPEMEGVDFVLDSQNGGKIMPHEAYPEQFKQWQNIQSIWDRRSLLFSLLDNMFSNKLQLWQVLERFTSDRYSQKALNIAKEHGKGEQLKDPNYWYALGRAQYHAGMNKEAEESLEECLKIDSTHKRGRIAKADLFHSTNRQNEAHGIYNSILKESNLGNKKDSMNLIELVGFKGVIHSPIYALAWLENHPETNIETWDEIAGEFYYSPYFRARHAYYLIEKKEQMNQMKGFAKLHSLSKEMPWFKEGVVNTFNMIDQLGLQDKMKEDKERLRKIIQENSWD